MLPGTSWLSAWRCCYGALPAQEPVVIAYCVFPCNFGDPGIQELRSGRAWSENCMARNLTKSDFKVAQTCPTKLYYKKSRYPSLYDEDEYLMLLAEGGYMVEKMGKLLFAEGREIGFESASEVAAQETLQALAAENVTLFEGTLISGQKLARVDILIKRGNEFQLIEVKAKSYDGQEDAAAKAEGRPSLFWKKKGGGIGSEWQEYLEDVAFQVLVLRELFPKAIIRPFLLMPDKSKTTQIDQLHSFFQIRRTKKSAERK